MKGVASSSGYFNPTRDYAWRTRLVEVWPANSTSLCLKDSYVKRAHQTINNPTFYSFCCPHSSRVVTGLYWMQGYSQSHQNVAPLKVIIISLQSSHYNSRLYIMLSLQNSAHTVFFTTFWSQIAWNWHLALFPSKLYFKHMEYYQLADWPEIAIQNTLCCELVAKVNWLYNYSVRLAKEIVIHFKFCSSINMVNDILVKEQSYFVI